jgi:hypothetical protein
MRRAVRPASFGLTSSRESHMGQLQFTASAVFSLLGSAIRALMKFLGSSWDGPNRRYRPEEHYMRGPGPKWREKNLSPTGHPPAIARRMG